jgi:hypothetical protein
MRGWKAQSGSPPRKAAVAKANLAGFTMIRAHPRPIDRRRESRRSAVKTNNRMGQIGLHYRTSLNESKEVRSSLGRSQNTAIFANR